MTKEDFESVLKVGEHIGVEFKRGGNGAQNDTFETICAFLNRFGGDIFLGVTDDGKVVGVPEGEVEPIKRHIVNVASDPHKQIGRADELGSGTRNLYHYVRLYSGSDPIIDEEDAFSVTVPLNDGYSPEVGKGTQGNDIAPTSIGDGTVNDTVNSTVNGTVNKTVELNNAGAAIADKIIEAITANSRITYDGLSAAIGMSRRTISREVKALLQQGTIRRVGPDKGGHWEVVK